jgi:hypothetical protein
MEEYLKPFRVKMISRRELKSQLLIQLLKVLSLIEKASSTLVTKATRTSSTKGSITLRE